MPNLYDDKSVLQDIHSVSSLLKMYFRELPNPICTYYLYDKFVEAAKSSDDQRLVLLRDVVQQLPPPNYRTLEYLSRHLYRVSLRGNDTGMTAKNVAIVWAPNLLRSKSIEIGGVAALQGVGVQAVVTEYLIRYCELIFNDKMPSYDLPAPETVKKPVQRPKSLAISTPTKLLSLEEARSRALAANMINAGVIDGTIKVDNQKYIEVGGGAATLPQKYHTVIDLPRRGVNGSTKGTRKSPMAWKAIFTSGKTKKPVDKMAVPPELEELIKEKNEAVNDNDLRNALPRSRMIRPAKSVESLNAGKAKEETSRPISVEMDEVAPLETVKKAVGSIIASRANNPSSPKCHSRSSSHDSYFERSVQFKMDEDDEEKKPEKTESELDLSEIQMNFDLEDNEMRIFSEDEAMLSTSAGSDLSRSLLDEESPKNRMSFREKFKRFTSPTSGRKNDDRSIKEKIVGALSPESLRRRSEMLLAEKAAKPVDVSPSKKKKASPSSSPNNLTVSLVKRSKIEDREEENLKTSIMMPLSPSIKFMDESTGSTAKLNEDTGEGYFSG